jgi:hypothetical protein
MAGVISPERIAAIVEDAPAWALIGLTAPREGVRADARLEIARHVYDTLYQPVDTETAQMALPW